MEVPNSIFYNVEIPDFEKSFFVPHYSQGKLGYRKYPGCALVRGNTANLIFIKDQEIITTTFEYENIIRIESGSLPYIFIICPNIIHVISAESLTHIFDIELFEKCKTAHVQGKHLFIHYSQSVSKYRLDQEWTLKVVFEESLESHFPTSRVQLSGNTILYDNEPLFDLEVVHPFVHDKDFLIFLHPEGLLIFYTVLLSSKKYEVMSSKNIYVPETKINTYDFVDNSKMEWKVDDEKLEKFRETLNL